MAEPREGLPPNRFEAEREQSIRQRQHGHYFKNVAHLKEIDVYRVLDLWGVTDPALQHALKKLLCAGQRGAKSAAKDVQEAIDSCERWKAMQAENAEQTGGRS